jgi:hypothetical protein
VQIGAATARPILQRGQLTYRAVAHVMPPLEEMWLAIMVDPRDWVPAGNYG